LLTAAGLLLCAIPARAQYPREVPLDIVVHLQDIGDLECSGGDFCGTRGQSRRLEGFSLSIAPPVPGLSIRYYGHVQDFGDTGWYYNGDFVGTRGESRRLEGFAIRLDGPAAGYYNVFYTCHIQDHGDSAVMQNGQYCGTRGESRRLEGMSVWIRRTW
jgi:uncharacterized protein YjdB